MHAALHIALVAVLVLAGSVRAAITVPNIDVAPGGPSLGCDVCNALGADLFAYLLKASTQRKWTDDANGWCNRTFATAPNNKRECEHVADALIKLMFHFIDDVKGWQVNVPDVLCADVLHSCVHVCCDDATTPNQIRLSFGDSNPVRAGSTMTVSWVTLNATGTVVWWRKAGTTDWRAAQGNRRTYTHGGWFGWIHGAPMSELDTNTTYEYKVGDGSTWSPVWSFTTLPSNIGTDARPLRVVQVADMGWGTYSNNTIDRIIDRVERGDVDFIIHPGDIGYADGDQHWWDLFGAKIEPITRRVPYMTVQGNHEQIWWNATAYKARWWMPAAGAGAPSDATYSHFVVGPIAFFQLDSETPWNMPDLDPTQLRWARALLLQQEQRFVVVTHHRPMYCSSYSIWDCTKGAKILRGQAEQLYNDVGVDVVFAGHVHNYERTLPVRNNTVTAANYSFPPSPVYITNGAAGNREGQAEFYTTNNTWSAFRSRARGYNFLTFSRRGDTIDMHAEFIKSDDATVLDDWTLTKRV